MEVLSIIVSIIAIFVSISSFQWNKSKHNLNQLQNNAKKFCDSLQDFIELGTEYHLSSYKFEVENIYHITNLEQKNTEYNDLQIQFSKRRDCCQNKYKILMESLDFFEFQNALEKNEFLIWVNKTLNNYYIKLHNFYGDLFEINFIASVAEKGLITEKEKEFLNLFFKNIRDLLDYNIAFSVLKRDISGYFAKLSLSDVGLFGNTKSALKKIEYELLRVVKEYGFDEAINKKDYSKIKKHCLDFGEQYDEFVEEEKAEFLKFLSVVKDIKKHNKSKI